MVRFHTARLRVARLLCLLGCLLLAPPTAQAKHDWYGWLQEFSGPGPFTGGELSLEFACLNVARKEVVDIRRAYPSLGPAGGTARQALADVEAFYLGVVQPTAASTPAQLTRPISLTGAYEYLAAIAQEASANPLLQPDVVRKELGSRLSTASAAVDTLRDQTTVAVMQVATGTSGRNLQSESVRRTRFIGRPGAREQSCWRSRPRLEHEIATELDRQGAAFAALVNDRTEAAEVVLARHDWQTGFVITSGFYRSNRNVLFEGRPDYPTQPVLDVIPLEFLVHSKMAPAIDIGAGLGAALFRTDFKGGPPAPTKKAAFYLVPLSVVVRPGAFIKDSRLAAALGYRVSVRYFGDLTGADFGAPFSTFRQRSEFLWGAAAFVDLLALLDR